MRLINQSYEILGTPQSLEEAWSFVAKAARNCYQSEKTRLDESEEQFCRRLLLKHPDDHECDHMSPFEFGIVYLTVSDYGPDEYGRVNCIIPLKGDYNKNPYSKVQFKHWEQEPNDLQKEFCKSIPRTTEYITTNLRVIIENGWEEDLKYAGSPTEHHVKACAFKLITNRAVMCELTRHRTLSFCIESTRYCNYSKNKFGGELTFIKPCWLKDLPDHIDVFSDYSFEGPNASFLAACADVEYRYIPMIENGWTPQQAATILPNALKTTIMMCGYEDNLQHMFRLRAKECSGPVHPQMAELMKPLYTDWNALRKS